MVEALNGTASLASYAYDAFEQRIEKDDGTDAVHYVYDLAGRLIAEHDGATGAALREYIYLGLMPAAYVDHSGAAPAAYYVHTDQVMRPRKLTDASAAILWDRIATPFGDEHTVTGSLTQLLEFPGQTKDSETSFSQNWHRDYDPELGRYVQSDPIGLLGGINTYGYVGGNPVSLVDPTGEFAPIVGAFLLRAALTAGTAVAIDYVAQCYFGVSVR
jgi:RHS repeat-associated protein